MKYTLTCSVLLAAVAILQENACQVASFQTPLHNNNKYQQCTHGRTISSGCDSSSTRGVFGPLRMASENNKDGDNDFLQQQKAQKNFAKIQGDLMALVSPASDFLDNVSGGWALSYADLTPNSERTLLCQVFLATNIAYTVVGLYLSLQGEVILGTFTEICSIASFGYHYAQLQQPYGRTQDSTVRLALLVDYVLAITSILIGLFYLIFDHAVPSPEGIAIAILGILCLLSCWVWEQGLPYIILHGLWHLCSAASAYYIGIAHVMS